MQKPEKGKIYLALIGVLAVAIVCVVIVGIRIAPEKEDFPAPHREAAQVITREVERIVPVEKLVEVEKTITPEILQEGLNDMGLLVTGEYYFTEVVGYSSVKKLLKTEIELPFTESSYLASYDGVVTAGVDFSGIRVERDDTAQRVTVFLPAAAVLNVDIDPNSFELHSEKTGFANPISVLDFNQSQIELENNAASRAREKGLLTRADENAKTVISNFVGSLLGPSGYALEWAAA